MLSKTYLTVLPLLSALPSLVNAHGFVGTISVNGASVTTGANPSNKFQTPAPETPGWLADNIDNGFVGVTGPDAICHKAATPGASYLAVAPGDTINLKWSDWPESHKGPVIDYLAPCPDNDCTTADPAALSFVKIAANGLASGSSPGTWADDIMIQNSLTWDVKVPSTLAPGNYVLRHELIALHQAQQPGGAQAYPQCINIQVAEGGSVPLPSGTTGDQLYQNDEPGIVFNLYTSFDSYPMPGPTLLANADQAIQPGQTDLIGGAAPTPAPAMVKARGLGQYVGA